MSDGTGETAWSYDARGRVAQQWKEIAGVSKTPGAQIENVACEHTDLSCFLNALKKGTFSAGPACKKPKAYYLTKGGGLGTFDIPPPPPPGGCDEIIQVLGMTEEGTPIFHIGFVCWDPGY